MEQSFLPLLVGKKSLLESPADCITADLLESSHQSGQLSWSIIAVRELGFSQGSTGSVLFLIYRVRQPGSSLPEGTDLQLSVVLHACNSLLRQEDH